MDFSWIYRINGQVERNAVFVYYVCDSSATSDSVAAAEDSNASGDSVGEAVASGDMEGVSPAEEPMSEAVVRPQAENSRIIMREWLVP